MPCQMLSYWVAVLFPAYEASLATRRYGRPDFRPWPNLATPSATLSSSASVSSQLSTRLSCQVKLTRQVGQLKSSMGMRAYNFQGTYQRLRGTEPEGILQRMTKAQCLEVVRSVRRHPPIHFLIGQANSGQRGGYGGQSTSALGMTAKFHIPVEGSTVAKLVQIIHLPGLSALCCIAV